MIPSVFMYKFPRLSDKYETIIAIGDTEQEAEINAEERLLRKNIYSPLDKIILVQQVESPRYNHFEATMQFLHPKYKQDLTEMELRRMNGVLSKVLFIDDTPETLEKMVTAAIDAQLYDVQYCNAPVGVPELVKDIEPEVLVMRHNMSGKNGFQVLHELEKLGYTHQKTVVYGRFQPDIVRKYHFMKEVWYFVKDVNVHAVLCAIEKVLNKTKAKTFDEFVIT